MLWDYNSTTNLNIENNKQIPATDKFIMLLSKLNLPYDEFIFHLDDEYLNSKLLIEKKLAEYVKRKNTVGLRELAKKSRYLFKKFEDIYFQHSNLISLAMIEVIENNHNFENARNYLKPISDYLTTIETLCYYEISLISQCIFMFKVELAISFGERALETINRQQEFYSNKPVTCVLLTNLAVYCLDYKDYLPQSLAYSQASTNFASLNNDTTRAIYAEIVSQVAHFKRQDGLFNKEHLFQLINTFKIINWQNEYKALLEFIENHGIFD